MQDHMQDHMEGNRDDVRQSLLSCQTHLTCSRPSQLLYCKCHPRQVAHPHLLACNMRVLVGRSAT